MPMKKRNKKKISYGEWLRRIDLCLASASGVVRDAQYWAGRLAPRAVCGQPAVVEGNFLTNAPFFSSDHKYECFI